MGFSLQYFIEDLLRIMADTSRDDAAKYSLLCRAIEEGANYAAQCGQITLPEATGEVA